MHIFKLPAQIPNEVSYTQNYQRFVIAQVVKKLQNSESPELLFRGDPSPSRQPYFSDKSRLFYKVLIKFFP